jgi:hypothetical protein
MKKKIYSLLCAGLLVASSCVDDYRDANPAPLLDAPTFRVFSAGSNEVIVSTPANRFQNTYEGFVSYQGPSEFTVNVLDAPGKVGAISVTPSVPDFGTVTLNESTITAIQGQEQGEFKFTFTPNPDLEDESDRSLNLVISVSDSQTSEDGEASAKTTTLTLPVTMASCISETVQEGVYQVTAASGNLDGGAAYTLADLEADFGGPIEVSIMKEFPGRYSIDEVTGGVWPTYYPGRANPHLFVDVCGTSIVGHAGGVTAGTVGGVSRTFTINGTQNNDGTITITWSYVRNDAPTPSNPAKGTYTLTKL